jgi:hypothetical protein
MVSNQIAYRRDDTGVVGQLVEHRGDQRFEDHDLQELG